MPFYSSHTTSGKLINRLRHLLDERGISAFGLSKAAGLSPTTTRKIYTDTMYIPSPDVLEKICLSLDVCPGEVLEIRSIMGSGILVASGVI